MKKLLIAFINNKLKGFLTGIILSAFILPGCKEVPTEVRVKNIDPEQTAQLAKSLESLVNAEVYEGLNLQLWGVDSLVADPVAIDIDNRGRLFYVRTNRRKSSEFDIRSHQDWEIPSMQLQTIEDKRIFLKKVLSPENSGKNEWLADLNGDGSHDWRDITVEKEHIYRLEDTSGDGMADRAQLVVADFDDELTDVAGAVLAYGEELFVGVAPDMWRMNDTNGDGVFNEKKSISHGYGIHVGFGGHGMSGLKMGPDGKIYWGIGDIGFNGKGPDGTKWTYPNRGVIVRANPDGSDFEVFAMGLRNTHEFVFDEYGNLISVDNDGDHRGEKERLVYIVNGSDAGWRINWQFGKYSDPDNNTYKVWMDEELFKPRFEGQAAYITPPIANYVSGPTGMVYNPGTAMGPEWENTFFIAEFVGNPVRSGIHAFKLKQEGASFKLQESKMILKGILATGIDFGPDGALYVADWISGWNTKDSGRIWKMDVEKGKEHSERQLTQKLLREGFSPYTETDLGELLQNADMRVRQKAQFELVKRGSAGAKEFNKYLQQKNHQLARVHAIWGISQLSRDDEQYAYSLLPLLKDDDPEIRAQAAKWLGDIRFKEAGDLLIPLLQDEYSRARFFAAEALGRTAYAPAVQPLIELLRINNDEDAYIRHAASLALARIGKTDPIISLAKDPSPAVRMGAVLALRRLSHPGIIAFLNDKNEYIVTEAARAINDDYSIEEALPALGNILQKTRFTNEPLIRRAINANLRVGSLESMQNLINYSYEETGPVNMRVEAIQALSTWAKPSALDRVDGRYRGEVERDINLLRTQAADPLIQLLNHQHMSLRLNAVKAIGKTGIAKGSSHLFNLLKNDGEAEVRIAALNALASMGDEQIDRAIEQALSDRTKIVRIAGLDLLPKQDIPKELKANLLSEVIDRRSIEEKQAALLSLGNLPVEYSLEIFESLLTRLEKGKLAPEIYLELAEAIDNTRIKGLKKRYETIISEIDQDSVVASYEGSLYGGDAELGKRIFFQNQTAQCIRCHSYDDLGGNAGPRINGIAGKLSRVELLEALIDPGKRLAGDFGSVSVELKNGKNINGILQQENDEALFIKVGNQADTVIRKEDVLQRNNAPSSMPNMRYLLTKREIRDLVSFLALQTEDEM